MTRKSPSSLTRNVSKTQTIETTMAMGQQYHARGQITSAEQCYRQVLAIDPRHVDALHMLGLVAFQSGHFDAAVKLIGEAQRLNPREPAIYSNLALAYRRTNDDAKAVELYEKALALNPDFWDALYNLGRLHLDAQNLDEAERLFKRCVALKPTDADGYINLGNAYKLAGKGDLAVAAYERALRLSPTLGHAYGNIAAVFLDRGWHNAALAVMDKAVALVPQPGELRFKRSLMALRAMRFDIGWEDYESRFAADVERIPRWPVPPPHWNGEDLTGKSIVIRTEQGLGDEILYSIMVPEIIARAKRCVVECSPRMVPIFRRAFPGAEVLRYKVQGTSVEPIEGLDYQISITSLGRFFRPSLDAFPRHQGYLKADAARTAELRARYEAIAPGNKIVGISWRSKAANVGRAKTAPLAEWGDILRVPGITFVNLQYGDCAEDLAAAKTACGVDVFHDGEIDSMSNMDDFFAQVAAMDLVVSTSNTAVHVAGSLNIPTWLMLITGPGSLWYWFLDRTDSPWYPSFELFRQPTFDEGEKTSWWSEPAKRVAARLAAWASAPRISASKSGS